MVLESGNDVFLKIFHISLPCLIVAVGAAVDDEAPFVVLRVDHALQCPGERLGRPVEARALVDEPFKLARRHFSGSRMKLCLVGI